MRQPLTPPDVYLSALQYAADGLPWARVADDPGALARAADAFRDAEHATASLLRERYGMSEGEARDVAWRFSGAAGDWLMTDAPRLEALRGALRDAWRDREPHWH
jgi:hypothetical protein